ncbi:MAG: L-glutamate gamma-semialdehyde dehydrogenase [Oscillospiraceae bacterium]|nr:L-glutamate gamma-semialdehyde dehydrogenase [Oscillospiraceae bacterium]
MNTIYSFPQPENEKVQTYAKGSPEREKIQAALTEIRDIVMEVPVIIDGKPVYTDDVMEITAPHDNKKVIARVHMAGEKEIEAAIESALKAKESWMRLPCDHRAAVFNRAAQLLSEKYRYQINAANMVCQSKTVHQAEIDAACELIDFLRFNTYFMSTIYSQQPNRTVSSVNRMEYRPVEGVILAIAPFNFTAIGGNLCTSPALMGNTVLWKPSEYAILSSYMFMQLLMEAGLPAGVINFVPCAGPNLTDTAIKSGHLGGIHFTGSTGVFNTIWKQVANGIDGLKEYPRMVGETGGKDFLFAHTSCDRKALITALIRGAFEYQGQKCSACSRAYIPQSVYDEIRNELTEKVESIRMGSPEDFSNFMCAVIHQRSYNNIKGYIDRAKASDDAEIIAGGVCDDSKGWFVRPTIIRAKTPYYESMVNEIFGPVLTIYVYDDDKLDETLAICNETSPYALTGSVFASDRFVIEKMLKALTYAAGNIYVNDKTTGAVVGQQPFGGGRKSGTNDKAGSHLNLMRWVTARTITENYNPPVDHTYSHMA